MDSKTLFYIGITLGFIGGIIATLIIVKVKSLFASGEVKKLRHEKKTLEKRLQEKNKYINEMMGHAEKLAVDVGKQKPENSQDR
jgi:predicted PP-loop superfamily ATPase